MASHNKRGFWQFKYKNVMRELCSQGTEWFEKSAQQMLAVD